MEEASSDPAGADVLSPCGGVSVQTFVRVWGGAGEWQAVPQDVPLSPSLSGGGPERAVLVPGHQTVEGLAKGRPQRSERKLRNPCSLH